MGATVKGQREASLQNVLYLHYINLSILGIILYHIILYHIIVVQGVIFGRNWVKDIWTLPIIFYNCMGIYSCLKIKKY